MKKTLLIISALAGLAASASAATLVYENTDSFTTVDGESVKLDVGTDAPTIGDSWTLQFDAALTGGDNWPYLVSFGAWGNNNYHYVWVSDERSAWGIEGHGTYKHTNSESGNFSVGTDTQTYTITSSGYAEGASSSTVSLYIGETLVATADCSFSTDYIHPLQYVVFGEMPGANNRFLEATISNVKVYDGVVSIPEPATATLSLLALAGLAARRRRK